MARDPGIAPAALMSGGFARPSGALLEIAMVVVGHDKAPYITNKRWF